MIYTVHLTNDAFKVSKVFKLSQTEGPVEEDPNGAWPFFTVLDAIATGKTVAITRSDTPGVTLTVSDESSEPAVIGNNTAAHHSTINASAIQVNDGQYST